MTWKRFQRAIWALLAACAGGVALLCLISGRGWMLVLGPVDSSDIFGILLLIFLLVLLVWGDGAIVALLKGWERVVSLVFVLLVEGLFLLTILFFGVYLYTNPQYVPLYTPSGEAGLVVRQECWLFKVWGEFYLPAGRYLPAGPCLLRSTGVTYEAKGSPFSDGRYYEIEWSEESIVIHYDNGMGERETRTVPLDQ